jgi:hypothetical protein
MDKVFNSAKKVYRDNYLEYKLTNDPKYKTASDSAIETMKKVITNLKSQTHGTKDIASKIVREKDLMRDLPDDSIIQNIPSLSSRYITLGIMSIVAFGLMVV